MIGRRESPDATAASRDRRRVKTRPAALPTAAAITDEDRAAVRLFFNALMNCGSAKSAANHRVDTPRGGQLRIRSGIESVDTGDD